MSNQDQIAKIVEGIQDVKFAMVNSMTFEGHLHAAPMTTAQLDLANKEIWFLGSKDSELVKDIKNNPQVNLAYSSPDQKTYVSINGKAELSEDKDKLDELWSPMYNAYYADGKDDDDIQLIKVVPNGAEYWFSGNGVINTFKIIAAAVQEGETAHDMGDNFSIRF